MKVVGFDTATDDTVVAATDGERLAFELCLPPDGRPVHSQALLEAAGEAAAVLGGWEEVDRIAVGKGPGTFTGIRIGVATASGLSFSTGTPATGVSTLAALARSIGGSTDAGRVMALLDARRGEVFGGLFDSRGNALEPPFACGPQELVEHIRKADVSGDRPVVGGPGAVRFRDELVRAGLVTEPAGSPVHRLNGRSICQLGAAAEQTGPETLEPLYLRVPDAQLWLERDSSKEPGRSQSG